jgi:hypothetical protein
MDRDHSHMLQQSNEMISQTTLKKSKTVNEFKKKIKTYLLKQAF